MKYNRFIFLIVRLGIFAAFVLLVLRPSMRSLLQPKESEIEKVYENSSPEVGLLKNWPKLTEDYENIKVLDLFRVSSEKANAYEHFKSTLGLESKTLKVIIPEALLNKLKHPEEKINWKGYQSTFSVFEGIEAFDHLKIVDMNSSSDLTDPSSWDRIPIDGYLNISQLVYLRLLKGFEDKRFDQAVREVRHFLKLIVTLDSKIFPLVVASSLKKENELREKLNANHLTTVPRLNEIQVNSLRSYFLTEGQLSDLRLSDDTFNKGLQMPLGLCRRLEDASKVVVIGHEVLKDKYKSQILRLKQSIKEKKDECTFNVALRLLQDNKTLSLNDEDLFRMTETLIIDTPAGEQSFTIEDLRKNHKLKERLIYQLLQVYSG